MKTKILLLLSLLAVCFSARAQDAASPTVPISNGTRASLNLNGSWQALPINGLTFTYPPPKEGWKEENVPSETSLITTQSRSYIPDATEALNAEGTAIARQDGMAAWFRRDFQVSATDLAGKRAVLHFGGMAFRSETWVNGTKVGTSVQGLLPLDYDITSLVRAGQANRIEIGLAGRESLIDVDNKTFIAPFMGLSAGIWGDVELRLVPEVSVSDIFVKTFVGAKRLEIETTVANAGKTSRTVQPQISVFDSRGVAQTSLQGESVTLAPGQQQTVTLKKDWMARFLWSPQTPIQYNARIDLHSAGAVVDTFNQRFGFREFEIRGRDFFLNGKRTVLLRDSVIINAASPAEHGRALTKAQAGQPYNTFRLHLGSNNEGLIEAADEIGVMIHPELAWGYLGSFPVEKSDVWLPNTVEYMRGFVRKYRNHPSITIWSMANETFWSRTDDEAMKVADRLLEAVRSVDPIRPQLGDGETSWGGRLPIITIHYPEGSGPLRKKYPNSGFLEPNDLYWLSDKGPNISHPDRTFIWDRPLIMGEYWDPGAITNDERTSFTGEAGYDFEKWNLTDRSGRDGQQSDYYDYLKRLTDVYRMQGVAGINPWGGMRNDIMPPVAVRPVDFHPNFFGGQTGTRKVVVFNDSGGNHNGMFLQCRLTVDGTTVWYKNIEANTETGRHSVVELPIQCPNVNKATKATLFVRLCTTWGGQWSQLSLHQESIYILPRQKATAADLSGVALLDTTGATARALSQLGANVPTKKSLTATDLSKATVLVIGAGTNAQPFRSVVDGFVRRGGRIIMLSQPYGVPLLPELAHTDDTHVATRTWIRSHNHPLLMGVSEAQMSYWKPDNIVSTLSLQKPSVGKSKTVVDAGGRFGLSWAPLLETPVGSGLVLQSQLNLVDRVEQEPLAGPLLLQMLRYARSYKSTARRHLQVLVGKNEALKEVLAATSIVTTPGLSTSPTAGPVLLDSSYVLKAGELQKLKSFVAAGGKIWLHGFSSANIGMVASLFPFKPQLTAADPKIQSGVRRSNDPLMSNISSQEFYWTRADFGTGGDFYTRAQQTAKLGGEVLTLPSLAAGEKLIEPGMLVKVPSDKGTLLFDSLLWEGALGAETEKVSRLITSLALNLGADVQVAAEKPYSYSHADISAQANMAFYDEVAGDGKGGWTDQGRNDMRFFMINHTGKAGGVESGMEERPTDFPTTAPLGGRPFRLLDPKKSDNRSVITLRSTIHGTNLPAQVMGIPYGQKAEKLWFLHTSCWAVSNTQHQEVGRYVIHYSDGTQSTFPIRYGLEVADWWDPKPLSNGKVAWSGQNLMHAPVGIYVSEWTNPHPKKTIKTIDIIGAKTEAQMVLVGITGGVEVNAAVAYKPIADWDMSKAANNSIASSVGGGKLAFGSGKEAPTVVESGGTSALRFQHGQQLVTFTNEVPGLAAGGPMNLQATITPEAKPDGHMGGIYEATNMNNGGFRLGLNGAMQVNVEIYPANGKPRYIVGKTILDVGQSYRIELKFDGRRAYLFINERLDASVDTPPPGPMQGRVLIGMASGQNYNFNGVISRIIVGVPQ